LCDQRYSSLLAESGVVLQSPFLVIDALAAYITNFTSIRPGVITSLYDANGIFQTVLNDPTKYGFKDTSSICGNSACGWADNVHCTYAMQKIFAASMAQLLGASNVTIPTSGSSGSWTKHDEYMLTHCPSILGDRWHNDLCSITAEHLRIRIMGACDSIWGISDQREDSKSEICSASSVDS
jgi:hypothetical protein